MAEDFADDVSGIGALAEPVRRSLYQYVVRQPGPVSREEAAAGCEVAPHTARFHLDRLVEVGLLHVEFRRLSGRSGPGAGRPAKLYVRSGREVSVTLPERRYDLAGQILAEAADRSLAQGVPLREALDEAAAAQGRRLAGTSTVHPDTEAAGAAEDQAQRAPADEVGRVAQVLEVGGYEPRTTESGVDLSNCPFDALARRHTELVCGLNVALVEGVVDELRCAHLEAVLDPQPDMCCVRVRPRH